jgi:hypothetical protein
MSPSQAYDVRSQEFTRLMVRAGQRLAEAPSGTPQPTRPGGS